MTAAALGALAALVAAVIGLTRFGGALVNAVDADRTPSTWPFAAGLTITEFAFALVAFGCGIGAVASRAGRRPGFVVVLVATAVVFGWAFSDVIYQIVTAVYGRR